MPTMESLTSETPWHRLSADDADWRDEDPQVLAYLLEQLLLIRRFEERILDLFKAGCVHGPAHASIGQEGGAVGAMSTLTDADKINATHRAHHQFLAKFLNHAAPSDYDPRADDWPEPMQEVVHRSMAEIMGLSPGYCGGRGGSMHMRWDEAGVLGTNAIVGGNPPQAVGYALAEKLRRSGNLTVTFFGDGAMQNGAAYESLNMAALYDLPIVFFIENNLYGVSTHVSETTRETRLSARGQGLAVPSVEVDGMDLMAVRKAMQWARGQIEADKGPALIESLTYRYFHQHGPMKGSAFGYRDKDEEEAWHARDPVATMPTRLIDLGLMDEAGVAALEGRATAAVEAAAQALTETEPGSNRLRVVPALWPETKEIDIGIRGDLSELDGVPRLEPEDVDPGSAREMTFIESIAAAQFHAMERDESVVVLGEDVHRLKGGTVGATKGIGEAYPERLIGTPIAENGFCGMGLGAAVNGLQPHRRDHVRRLLPGGGGSALQSGRQGAAHVRRRPRRAADPARPRGGGRGLRLAAFDGPVGRVRALARLAHHRAHHALRLRGALQQRRPLQRPGGDHRVPGALPGEGPGAGRPRLLHPLRQGARRPPRLSLHGGDLRQHGAGERRRRRRRRASTPR